MFNFKSSLVKVEIQDGVFVEMPTSVIQSVYVWAQNLDLPDWEELDIRSQQFYLKIFSIVSAATKETYPLLYHFRRDWTEHRYNMGLNTDTTRKQKSSNEQAEDESMNITEELEKL